MMAWTIALVSQTEENAPFAKLVSAKRSVTNAMSDSV